MEYALHLEGWSSVLIIFEGKCPWQALPLSTCQYLQRAPVILGADKG